MMNKPVVSVIIPTYNNAKYLPDAIDSLLNQSLNEIEILVINDGSTDETIPALQKYGSAIKLINQENQGQSAAINTGIKHCISDYVAFMDADDVSVPQRIELQSGFLDSHPEIGVVGSDLYYMDRNKRIIAYQRMPVLDVPIRWRGLTNVPCYNFMIRKSILEKFNIRYPVGIPYAQDYSFLIDMLQHTRAYSIPKALLGYRMHGKNETNRDLESRLSFHVPVALKSIRLELGIEYDSVELLTRLCALMLEGVRHYPFEARDRAVLADLYLGLWGKFKEIHGNDINIEDIQKEILIRVATFALYPPLPAGWFPVIKRLLSEDKLLPLYILGNIFQFGRNIQYSNKIRKSHLG
jgi:glycosyltransferase involved in cell wall biosynthesis